MQWRTERQSGQTGAMQRTREKSRAPMIDGVRMHERLTEPLQPTRATEPFAQHAPAECGPRS
jgi:hypothetical protein